MKHEYAQPGIYDVTLTGTCNYGYTDQIAQTVVVGETDEPEELDLVGDFAIVSTFWEVDDEEEETACVTIWGSVTNIALTAAGCELTATAYDAFENPVGTATSWASANANIASGGTVPCNLLI